MRIINFVVRECSEGGRLSQGVSNPLLILDVQEQGGCGGDRDGNQDEKKIIDMEDLGRLGGSVS